MPASATQLRLIPWERPLDERLGSGFFRQLPRRPGVYQMLGADGGLLYVGKAGDLRQRLSSYRSVAHASRKTVRLVHAVRAITWEVCATEEAAALLENELLRTHRPRFNRMGVWPQANGYVELVRSTAGLRLRFVRRWATDAAEEEERLIENRGGVFARPGDDEPLDIPLTRPPGTLSPARSGGEGRGEGVRFMESPLSVPRRVERPGSAAAGDRWLFGAFKPGARFACGALLRLLWGHREDWPEPVQLPRSLLSADGATACCLSHLSRRITELVRALLAGQSAELLNECVGFAEVPGSPFLREFWRRDWELAGDFYRTGPARNRALRERFGGGDALVGESELDDLLVRWRRAGPS